MRLPSVTCRVLGVFPAAFVASSVCAAELWVFQGRKTYIG